jgi:hypothetical protein
MTKPLPPKLNWTLPNLNKPPPIKLVFAKMGKLALTPDPAPKINQGSLNVNRLLWNLKTEVL